MKRILLATEPCQYGVFRFVEQIVSYLHKHCPNWKIDLAYSTRRGSDALLSVLKEVELHGGQVFDLGVSSAPEIKDFFAFYKAWNYCHRYKPDLIHCHSSKAGAIFRLLKPLLGSTPIIYTPNAYYGMGKQGTYREKLYNFIEAILAPAAWTLNCSQDEQRFATDDLKISKRQTILLHHSINLNRFSPPMSPEIKQEARRHLNLPQDVRIWATVGRNALQKNYEPLYTAFANTPVEKKSPIILAHAGEGASLLKAQLPSTHKPYVHTFEFLDSPERLYQAADVFVMTSLYESICLTVMEALASGLKCVLTHAPGFVGYAHLGFDKIHWLPDPKETNELVLALKDAFQSLASLSHEEGLQQYEIAKNWFDEEKQMNELVQIYSHFLEHKTIPAHG